MAFKSRSKGKIAKVEGRITELCLSATVCCFLPVRSKPLFTYKLAFFLLCLFVFFLLFVQFFCFVLVFFLLGVPNHIF